MSVRWSVELVTASYVIPRLENRMIDELFYQEDEIGEMRHTAFMIECGLEEDPPDGPDVPPVPWGDMLLKQQTADRFEPLAGDSGHTSESVRQRRRELPSRSRSTDAMTALERELKGPNNNDLLRSPRTRPKRSSKSKPKRNHSVDGGTILTMRNHSQQEKQKRPERSPRKNPPGKSHSNDDVLSNMGLSLSFAKTDPSHKKLRKPRSRTMEEENTDHAKGRAAPVVRKLYTAKSGTPHELRTAAANAQIDGQSENQPKGRAAPVVRKMMAVKSGTLHGMRKTREPQDDSDDNDGDESPRIVYKNGKKTLIKNDGGSSTQRPSLSKSRFRNSERSNNSSNHSKNSDKSVVYKNGRKLDQRRSSSFMSRSSFSDDDFLDDVVSSDDESSEISISTCGSAISDTLFPDGDTTVLLGSIASSIPSRDPPRKASGKAYSPKRDKAIRSPTLPSRMGYNSIDRTSSVEDSDALSPRDDSKKSKKKKKKDKVEASPLSEKKKKKKKKESKGELNSTEHDRIQESVRSIRKQFESTSMRSDEGLNGTSPKKSPKEKKSSQKSSPSDHSPIRPGDWLNPLEKSTPRKSWRLKTTKEKSKDKEIDMNIPPAFRASYKR